RAAYSYRAPVVRVTAGQPYRPAPWFDPGRTRPRQRDRWPRHGNTRPAGAPRAYSLDYRRKSRPGLVARITSRFGLDRIDPISRIAGLELAGHDSADGRYLTRPPGNRANLHHVPGVRRLDQDPRTEVQPDMIRIGHATAAARNE